MSIEVKLTLKEVYALLCPKCKKKLKKRVAEKIAEQLAEKALVGSEKKSK